MTFPWTHEDQDVPIKSGDRVVPESIDGSDNVIVNLVVGCDPRQPIESRESQENVVRQLGQCVRYAENDSIKLATYPEVGKHGGKGQDEAPHPGHSEDLAEWSHDGRAIVTLM